MLCTVTRHASVRMQQRAIPPEALELLLDFGSSARCGRAERFFFDRAARRRANKSLGPQALCRAERHLNTYAVVGDDGAVITAAWRRHRLHRA